MNNRLPSETAPRSQRFRCTAARRALLGRALAATACLVVAAAAQGQQAEPLRVRNLNPFVAVFGLPTWDVTPPGTRLEVTTELANHYRFSVRGGDRIGFDGETLRATVSLDHGFAGRWAIGVDVPYYRQSGGVLDDLIDGWHAAFNLPDGARNVRPEDALEFSAAVGTNEFYALRDSGGGWGDVQLKVSTYWGDARRFIVQGSLKLPTGDEALLAGSGSADLAVTLLRAQRVRGPRARPAGYYWGVGALYLGDADAIAFDARSFGVTGLAGGSLKPWMRTGLKLQIDYHSALYDSPLEEIGEKAIQATLGVWHELGETATLEVALVEDLEVSASPDVVIQAAFQWLW